MSGWSPVMGSPPGPPLWVFECRRSSCSCVVDELVVRTAPLVAWHVLILAIGRPDVALVAGSCRSRGARSNRRSLARRRTAPVWPGSDASSRTDTTDPHLHGKGDQLSAQREMNCPPTGILDCPLSLWLSVTRRETRVHRDHLNVGSWPARECQDSSARRHQATVSAPTTAAEHGTNSRCQTGTVPSVGVADATAQRPGTA